ncbi:MAG: hypothetical protein NTV00_06220 [Methylococcales bacterium]|nr:hypothetical protein [Methylococcales bacterium]
MRYHLQLTIFFLFIISTPLVLTLINDNSHLLQNERRVSSPLPAIPQSLYEWPEFPAKLEQYIDDHFGLRPVFLWLYHQLKNAINDSSSKIVIHGKNDWLFYDQEIDSYRHISKYTEAQLIKFAETIEYRRLWLKSRGIDYVIIIAPNKSSIYPEYMPDYLNKIQPESALDQLLSYAKQHINVPILDLRSNLNQAKSQGLLYYKYDTHWNIFGGNIAQYQIAQYLAKMYPNKIHPQLFSADDYIFSKETDGDLSNTIHQQPDNTQSLAAIKPASIMNACANAFKPYDEHEVVTIQCPNNQLNAIIFKDSFFSSLLAYIGNYFNNSTYISSEFNLDIIDYYIKNQPINIAIEEIVERKVPYMPQLSAAQEYAQLTPLFDQSTQSVFTLSPVTLPPQNTDFKTLAWQDNHLIIDVSNTDPMLTLSFNQNHPNAQFLLKIAIEAPETTEMQLFYAQLHSAPQFTDQRSKKRLLAKGMNTLLIPISITNFNGQLRLDPGSVKGRYIIHTLEIKALASNL